MEDTIDGLTAVQHQALTKPCPVCQSTLDTVGDLADFDHDIIVCTNCEYAMFFDGSTMGTLNAMKSDKGERV